MCLLGPSEIRVTSTSLSPFARDCVTTETNRILGSISPLLGTPPPQPESLSKIVELVLVFALQLRRQRAVWHLAFPTPVVDLKDSGPLKVPFDSRCMTSTSEGMEDSVRDDGDAKQESIVENNKSVGLFVVPALFKRGNMDGQKFDADEYVVEKALVCLD